MFIAVKTEKPYCEQIINTDQIARTRYGTTFLKRETGDEPIKVLEIWMAGNAESSNACTIRFSGETAERLSKLLDLFSDYSIP